MCSPTCSPVLPVQSHSITLLRSIIEMTFLTLFLSLEEEEMMMMMSYSFISLQVMMNGLQAIRHQGPFTIKIQRWLILFYFFSPFYSQHLFFLFLFSFLHCMRERTARGNKSNVPLFHGRHCCCIVVLSYSSGLYVNRPWHQPRTFLLHHWQ